MAYLYSAVQVKNMMVIFDPFSSFDSKYILSLSCFDSSLDSPENWCSAAWEPQSDQVPSLFNILQRLPIAF